MKVYYVDDPPCPGSYCALEPPVVYMYMYLHLCYIYMCMYNNMYMYMYYDCYSLTVEEHLLFYGQLKGLSRKEVKKQIPE